MKRTDITSLFPEIEKEKLDRIMELNGADINAARAEQDQLREQLAAAQNELKALKDKPADNGMAAQLQAVTDELTALKLANSLRELRERVSKETGVPASLLTAESEDACKAQAESIKAYAKDAQPAGYPRIPDGGEVHGIAGASATRDKFADWMQENFPAK